MTHKMDEWRRKRVALEKLPFTQEEKDRWAPMLQDTWGAIAGDAEQAMRDCGERLTKAIIIEYVCDANRPEMFAGMTREEYEFLCVVWGRTAGKRWLSKVLNY